MCCMRQRGQYSCIGTADIGRRVEGEEAVEERERDGQRGLKEVGGAEEGAPRRKEGQEEKRGEVYLQIVEVVLWLVDVVMVAREAVCEVVEPVEDDAEEEARNESRRGRALSGGRWRGKGWRDWDRHAWHQARSIVATNERPKQERERESGKKL